jgi:hypothetical protein
MAKPKEKTWYATFNKDATLIWGYGNTKKQAEKEARKFYKEWKDDDGVGAEKEELYKTVEVSEDVIEYMENIGDNLEGCLRVSMYYYEDSVKGGTHVVLNEEAEERLHTFKYRQENISDFRKAFKNI